MFSRALTLKLHKNLKMSNFALKGGFRLTVVILHMCVSCDKTFLSVPKIFDLVTLTFDLLLKKLNLRHNFLTKRDGAFILLVCISCGSTFLFVPKKLTLWSWPWLLTYFWKNLTLAIIFKPEEIACFHISHVYFLWQDLSVNIKIFDFMTLTLTFDLLLKKT